MSDDLSYSPSLGKPKKLIEHLQKAKVILDIDDSFLPLTRSDLALAHDQAMVNNVLDLKIKNGFGNKSPEISESLPYTNGSFYAAAKWALEKKVNTFSPTSGFHHAHYSSPGNFCTFNGLMVAALKLKQEHPNLRVGIIDCDQHYGDGIEDIISTLRINWIIHYSFASKNVCPGNSEDWLNGFETELKLFNQVDVIYYQAGADPHIDDPLGGTMTSEQLKRRDEIVFETFKALNIPIVWNLAGGYQDPIETVLDLHQVTYEIAMRQSL